MDRFADDGKLGQGFTSADDGKLSQDLLLLVLS